MKQFVRLHDDILALNLPMEERVVFALIAQLSENGQGFWAGYKAMADRLNIHKSDCKRYVEHLRDEGMITVTTERIKNQTRLVFRSNSGQ